MSKITALPAVAVPNGTETVVAVRDGITRQVRVGPLVGAAAAPFIAQAQAAAIAAAAFAAGHYFDTVEAGVAGVDDGEHFVVAGVGFVSIGLFKRRGAGSDLVTSLPSMAAMAIYGTIAPVAVGTQVDQSPTINALFTQTDVDTVILPPGLVWVERCVRVPTGKKLMLKASTILRAMPSFSFSGEGARNHVVLLEGDGASIEGEPGAEVDGNKVGLGNGTGARINGITVFNGARNCRRTDVIVRNCTGYAVYDSGASNRLTPPSSSNHRVTVFNSQIHFEQQGADGSTYDECRSGDGDGDVPCLSWIHPLVGSKNIAFTRFRGVGATPAALDLTANIGDLEDISIDDSFFEQTNEGGVSLSVPPGWLNTKRLNVSRSTFISHGGIGGSFQSTTGVFTACRFIGGNAIESTNSVLEFVGCTAQAYRADGATQASFGIYESGGSVRWNAGEIEVLNPAGAVTAQGNVRMSADTKQTPAPATGGGFAIRYQAAGVAIITNDGSNSFANVFADFVNAGRAVLTFALFRKKGDAYAGTTWPRMTWSVVGAGFIRIRIGGMNFDPAEFEIRWHLIEPA